MHNALIGTAVAIALASSGCVDARDEYEDFNHRLIDAGGTGVDGRIVSNLPDVTGEFYVVARPNLSQDFFFNFIGTAVFTPVTENTGRFSWSVQPLDFQTFEPVGDPIMANDVVVRADASADIPLVGLLPGRANSITQADVNMNGVIHAQLRSADLMCGDLSGTAGSLNLAGSTFGSVRITGSTLPDPVWMCPP